MAFNLDNILGNVQNASERSWLSDDQILKLVRYAPCAGQHIKIVDNAELRWAIVHTASLKGDTTRLERLIVPCNTAAATSDGGNHWVVYSVQIYAHCIIITRYNSLGTYVIARDADVQMVISNTFPNHVIDLVPGICARQNDGWSCGHRVVRIIRALLLEQPVPCEHTLQDSLDLARELE